MTAAASLRKVRSSFLLLAVLLSACGDAHSTASAKNPLLERDDEVAATDPSPGCERWPQRASRPRRVVVSHPYDESGSSSNIYEVLDLSEDGTLSTTGVRFRMGRLAFGRIVFTPDGQVGMAAQDDGSIGVFRFDRLGVVRVVHSRLTGLGYAGSLVVDPRGDRVYVLDNEWRESGGGIYVARIGCDGTLSPEGMLAPSKRPAALQFLLGPRREDPPRAILAAVDVLSSAAGNNMHLLRWPTRLPTAPTILGGVDGFGDDEAIVSALAMTADEKYALVGDNSEFSGVGNRIAVVALEGDKLRSVDVLSPVNDPVAILMSPWNNAGLVVSGYGNAIFRLTYDPAAMTTPFTNKGGITYVGRRPQLPSGAELIERGRLRGRVLVAELEGVRQVSFESDGSIKDLGLFSLGEDLDTIVGAIGVQP